MRRYRPLLSVLFLLPIALAACHGPKRAADSSSSEMPGAESVRPAGAMVSFELEDGVELAPGLESWFGKLLEAVARGDLDSALSYFDPAHREEQRSWGLLDDAQYVLEGLGLSRSAQLEGQLLPDEPDYAALFSNLRLFVVNDFVGAGRGGKGLFHDRYVARGEMRFAKGEIYLLRVDIRRLDGGWVVSPPVG